MAKWRRVFFAVAVSAVFLAPEALAAKGVIKQSNGGGMPGRIIVIDTGGQIGIGTKAGDTILFTEDAARLGILEGDYVSFEIVPDAAGCPDPDSICEIASSISLIAKGTVITGNMGASLTISANQSVLVKSTGSIGGNVSVNGGVLIVLGGKAKGNITIGANSTIICKDNAVVTGGSFKIEGGGANSIVIITDSTVNGSFSTSGINNSKLIGNTLDGNVSSQNDGDVTITGNTINGYLTVSGVTGTCNVSGNTVSGSTTLDPKCH